MDKNKSNDLAAILKNQKNGLERDKDKASNDQLEQKETIHKESKSKTQAKPKKVQKNSYKTGSARKPIRYSNIRTNASIVQKLGIMAKVHGSKSRAELLDEMIQICWPKFIHTSKQKQEARKIARVERKVNELKRSI